MSTMVDRAGRPWGGRSRWSCRPAPTRSMQRWSMAWPWRRVAPL